MMAGQEYDYKLKLDDLLVSSAVWGDGIYHYLMKCVVKTGLMFHEIFGLTEGIYG